MTVKQTSALAAAIVAATLRAELQLPAWCAENMVVQRGAPFVLTGRSSPGAEISGRFGDAGARAVADEHGRWRMEFPAKDATDEPVTLSISGDGGERKIKHCRVGDVYLVCGSGLGPQFRKGRVDARAPFVLTGRSSPGAEISGRFGDASAAVKAAAGCERVRLFCVNTQRADCADYDRALERGFVKFGGWHTPNANLARTPHLVFGLARRIAARSTVPVGIVYAEAGTEAIEALIPADAYRPAGLTQLADRAERCLPTTALGRAEIVRHVAALREWAGNAAACLEAGGGAAPACPQLPHLSSTECASVWNGTLAPLAPLKFAGVCWPNTQTAARDGLRELKLRTFARCLSEHFGDGAALTVVPIPSGDDRSDDSAIRRGESAGELLLERREKGEAAK